MLNQEKEDALITTDQRKLLPVSYNYITRKPRKAHKKTSQSYWGFGVEALGTTMYFPTGHHKPISKIIDLKIFEDGKEPDKK